MKKIVLISLMVSTILLSSEIVSGFGLGEVKNVVAETVKKPQDTRSDISKQFESIPMWEWKKGMKFTPKEGKYTLGYRIPLKPYKSKKYSSGLEVKDYQGKIFTVNKVIERKVSCPRGKCTRTYVVFSIEGKKKPYEYEYIGTKNEMKKAEYKSFQQISYLKYVGDISKARELLKGKTFYVRTRAWKGDKIALKNAKQYIPVKIMNVGISNDTYNDMSISFETTDGIKAYLDVTLGGTNIQTQVVNSHQFDLIFSADNPKESYKGRIEMWDVITQGNVRIGMTEEEVIWSWGKPNKINKSYPSPNQWIYEAKHYDSQYLYFKNGKLVSYN